MSYISLFKSLIFFFLLLAANIRAEEAAYLHSVVMDIEGFQEKADAVHIMTHTSKFSIFPLSHHNATFIQTPQVQGGDAVSSLIGALIAVSLINSHQSKESDAAAKFNADLSSILQTMDISEEFNAVLQQKLAQHFAQTQFEVENALSRNTLNQAGLLVRIKQNYILTFENRLYFDSKLQSLCFETSPRLWLKDKVKPAYLSEVKYVSNPIMSEDKGLLKANWTQNNGERLKQSIRDGLQASVEMFIKDFLDPAWKTGPESVVREMAMTDTHTGKIDKHPLLVLSETPDRIAGRMFAYDAAQLISAPKSQIAH